MAIPVKLRERMLACVREHRAEQGEKKLLSGTLFVELEDEACEIGDAIAAAMIEGALTEHATQSVAEETACCPRCGRLGKRNAEPAPRLVQTRRGEVGWNEPNYDCRHCRQAFFPARSHPASGLRATGRRTDTNSRTHCGIIGRRRRARLLA